MADTRFDDAARGIPRLDPAGFFAWLLIGFARFLKWRMWLGERTTPAREESAQTGDLVACLEELTRVLPPWLLPIEFQTIPDPKMFGRLLREMGSLWEQNQPDETQDSRFQVAAAVINLTGTPRSAPASREYRLPLPPQQRPRAAAPGAQTEEVDWVGTAFRVVEIHVAVESAAATLDLIATQEIGLCIACLIPLMQGGGDPGIIQRTLELAAGEPDSAKRGEMAVLMLTMAELTDHHAKWQEALKEWNMLESQTLRGFLNQGLREGRLEALRETLQDLLIDRFQTVSTKVREGIQNCQDASKLKAAVLQVAHINSPDELSL